MRRRACRFVYFVFELLVVWLYEWLSGWEVGYVVFWNDVKLGRHLCKVGYLCNECVLGCWVGLGSRFDYWGILGLGVLID